MSPSPPQEGGPMPPFISPGELTPRRRRGPELLPTPSMEVTTLLVLSLELSSSLMVWDGGCHSQGRWRVPLLSRLHGLFEIIHREWHSECLKKHTRRLVNLPIDFSGELTLPHKTLNNSSWGIFLILFGLGNQGCPRHCPCGFVPPLLRVPEHCELKSYKVGVGFQIRGS